MGQTFDGLIQRKVSRIKAKNNLGDHITLYELFPDSFIKEHTQFSSIEELFENGSFTSDDEGIDGHIFIMTDFNTLDEMADEAARGILRKEP